MREIYSKYISLFLIWFWAFITPVTPAFLTILFLVVSDTITGIWKATKQKESIQSKKLFSFITKFVLYSIAILCALSFEKYIIENALPLSKIILGFIAAIELKSVYENINILVGVNLWDRIKSLIDRK